MGYLIYPESFPFRVYLPHLWTELCFTTIFWLKMGNPDRWAVSTH